MADEPTRELPDRRSFEERVFARFDAMDARFDAMDARFNAVDARFEAMDARFDSVEIRLDGLDVRVQALEAKALDTKPIWERALAEILEVKNGVEDLNRKVDVLTLDVMQTRADQRRVEKRLDKLESRVQ
jgi:chromosome segregation ATPase